MESKNSSKIRKRRQKALNNQIVRTRKWRKRKNVSEDIREAALRTIFQFRSSPVPPSSNSHLIRPEIVKIQTQIKEDLDNHHRMLDPRKYEGCSSCGKIFFNEELTAFRRNMCTEWIQLLQNKTYGSEKGPYLFCESCKRNLRKGCVSKYSLCNGWVFGDRIPHELSCLNKDEVLLISLRLPIIPVWRDIPGFSQYASKITPVSFSNPVSALCNNLPRNPNEVFKSILDNGQVVYISALRILEALNWLKRNNELYRWISINDKTLKIIQDDYNEDVIEPPINENELETIYTPKSTIIETEQNAGAQGPQDELALKESIERRALGVLDIHNPIETKLLIRHMLQPFKYRQKDLIPSYDATKNLESYFPCLFPYGTGGPEYTKTNFATWIRHCLEVKDSRFSKNIPFLFFTNSVHQRAKITGLSMNAKIVEKCSNAILDVKKLLEGHLPKQQIIERIDKLVRSGTISASFEKLKGSPAYWASMKRTSWSYLTFFGPCQLFITMSVADLTDPFVFMESNSNLSYQEASNLSSQERAQLLSENPVAANSIFHRRVQSLLDNFLFGKTKPFGRIQAYLGRVEMQARHSPHLHLLLWTEKKMPHISDELYKDGSIVNLIQYLETFNTALRPESELVNSQSLIPIRADLPIPIFKSLRKDPKHKLGLKMKGELRHSILTEKLDSDVFDRSEINNKKIGNLLRATQTHICNDYCSKSDEQCRFGFPFPRQERSSICIRQIDTNKSHYLALTPRNSPYLNKTHPMLAVMAKANTDVTVILGKGIAESMYVSNYAVKSDKQVLFNRSALRKLYKVMETNPEEKTLLSSIARGSLGAKVVGAQEAVSSLLGSPLIFQSAAITNVSIKYILTVPGALSDHEKTCYSADEVLNTNEGSEILPELDQDINVSKPIPQESNIIELDPFLKLYVRRPMKLDSQSAVEFNNRYKIVRLSKNRKNYDSELLLTKPTDFDVKQSSTTYIADERKPLNNRPKDVNILNVIDKGIANDDSPRFAAAALSLNVPFRTMEDLLQGRTLTKQLKYLLSERSLPELNTYVSRCHELSINLNQNNTHSTDEHEFINHEDDQPHRDDSSEEDEGILAAFDFDDLGINNKLTTVFEKSWENADISKIHGQLQLELYQEYVRTCRSKGVTHANSILENPLVVDDSIKESAMGNRNTIDSKQKLFRLCKTIEQRDWLESVLCYIQVYYSNRNDIPENLIDICRNNPPILTNAPGGCGKSWLISKLKSFVIKCVPPKQLPVYLQSDDENSICDDIEIESCNMNSRFGRVATFAPSGVAAANCDGFTFHNGLHTHQISKKELNEDISTKTLKKLKRDFMYVQCIVIDEFSMVSLVILAYLNKVLLTIFPDRSNTLFAGILIVISGDGFQLPVVQGKGILSDIGRVSEDSLINEVHTHFNIGAFYLELNQSVRQASDKEYSDILMRMRISSCTDTDEAVLNKRYFPSIDNLGSESKHWKTAPVLTGTNQVTREINAKSTFKNASAYGVFSIHNLPVLSKSSSVQKQENILNKFWNTKSSENDTNSGGSRFTAPPQLNLYPGMPVMLRMNICPSLGLSNGSIGTVVAVLRNGLPPQETISAVKQRILSDSPESTLIPSVLIDFKNYYKGRISAVKQEQNRSSHLNESTVLIEPHCFGRVKGLPLSPAHSITMHKSQSLTIPYCIIDPRNTFVMGQLYVAFSRAPGLQNIALTSPVSTAVLNKFKKSCQRVIETLNSIRENSSSFKPFIEYIRVREEEEEDHFAV